MEPQNNGHKLTETAIKWKNDDFFVMPLKHVPSVMDLVNQFRTPKLWAMAHENGPKTLPQKNVLSVMDPVNQPGTPKLWAIAHENGPKTQKL
jgi:hypothetical protein